MTTRSTGPLPCRRCDAALATQPTDDRASYHTLRWYLDDRQRAAGRPHRHVRDATEADLHDFEAALDREQATAQELLRLARDLRALVSRVVRDDTATWRAIEAQLACAGEVATAVGAHALLAEIEQREQARTYYLGGGPSLGRDADGTYVFLVRPPDPEAEP
jgi:hypothetical protein